MSENNILKKGLTTSQAQEYFEDGMYNINQSNLTKSIPQIIKSNTWTLFNLINIVLAAMVFYTGDYKNLLFIVVAVINTIVGTIQEIRSKRQLDKMAILSKNKVKVVRDNKIMEIDQDNIVLNDVLLLNHGDQVPIDGQIIENNFVSVDESQITGESKPIAKHTNDKITSGSFIISGSAYILVEKVGSDTFVNKITNEVKHDNGRENNSKLLNTINKIIKILTIIIVPLGLVLFISNLMHGNDVNNSILGTVAAMTGMIPEGLVLLSTVTLAVSALKLTRKKVLVRNLPAIETLARVDTLCLDKTGTITTGQLKFDRTVNMSNVSDEYLNKVIGAVIYSDEDSNETALALKNAFKKPNLKINKYIPFASERKWSGADVDNLGSFVLGAPQFVLPNMSDDTRQRIESYTKRGYRVLCLAKNQSTLQEELDSPKLLSLILINDLIRPDAVDTLKYFAEQDITLKIISGDDPNTVSSIGKRVNIPNAEKMIDMSTVNDTDDFKKIASQYTVFGRVTPEQKKKLVKALQDNKHTVAMTGDGVNDILSLKQADCGIAMASGSESAKGISNFVLLDSNFSSMVNVLGEGRRVINNISSVSSLYLIKTMFSLALSILFIFSSHDYPFQPIQLTPISTFMVGLPSFLLALAPNYQRVTDQFYRKIFNVALPGAITIVGYILVIMYAGKWFGFDYMDRSSLNVLITGIICWIALFLVSKPINKSKLMIIIPTGVIFLVVFLFLGKVFDYVSMFEFPIAMIALTIGLTAYPILTVVQKLVVKVIDKYHEWQQRESF
ncbi:HAD-IC family P-type ATPase [Apilactobacillus xinyiensis]|uniref:HAD-IC family P-type ATPase n=1 Tax=Apilactobacillus xinyiensis TaxID=2841032 RepID=UPI00200C09BC|nr:HAD-IC family P-type ATPase [Apilactobacillus xinyiensis]MCL0330498.1 HAD-IC family P-type ATPase [Apilactobacillus xinyiensis]